MDTQLDQSIFGKTAHQANLTHSAIPPRAAHYVTPAIHRHLHLQWCKRETGYAMDQNCIKSRFCSGSDNSQVQGWRLIVNTSILPLLGSHRICQSVTPSIGTRDTNSSEICRTSSGYTCCLSWQGF